MPNILNRIQHWVGPTGLWFNRSVAWLLATWITHGLLRAFLLFRNDAFGFPMVGKADWYIFHALFIDLHWIFLWSTPFLILLLLGRKIFPKMGITVFSILVLLHSLLLLVTIIDHETLRFMGMHFDLGIASTYGNSAAVREVFHFIASDRSLPGLQLGLFFGTIPFTLFIYSRIARTSWARAKTLSVRPLLWALFGCALGYAYLYHIWTGGHRMAKLRPFIQSAVLSLKREHNTELAPDSLSFLTENYRFLWKSTGADSNWIFPKPDWPYYKEPLKSTCVPEPLDIPGNGIDEDCNGVDAKPWNFIFFLLESHRALNVGHLRPYGAIDSATPFLDSLAHAGHFWTRAVISGIPTINALIATHLSIVQHPTRLISSEFANLEHQAFTTTLSKYGFTTHYFSAADPAWDNQTPWLRQWYQNFSYSREREDDASMFQHMSHWMRDSMPQEKPFFVTAMTKTNHYPFNPVPGMRALPDSASFTARMSATMAYTDSCMRSFVASLRGKPWFDHTVFIAIADHGFPLSEHGSSNIGHGLYTESVWLPMVMSGAHPKLGLPRPHHALAAEMDLGPTILDLAGIRDPNAFMGHSLLHPVNLEAQFNFCVLGEQGFVEKGNFRWHGAWGVPERIQGEELFDLITDRTEKHNILALHPSLADSSKKSMQDITRLHLHVIEHNRLWPDSL